MPTYDGIGETITHKLEIEGDLFLQDIEGGTNSTQVPLEIFSDFTSSNDESINSRMLRLRVNNLNAIQDDNSNIYVTDMGIKGQVDKDYFFITAPQNTSNVGDQNTFVISKTSNVGIGTTDPGHYRLLVNNSSTKHFGVPGNDTPTTGDTLVYNESGEWVYHFVEGTLPPGTVNNEILTWNGVNWVPNHSIVTTNSNTAIGIGTYTPSSNLHVIGSVTATSDVDISGKFQGGKLRVGSLLSAVPTNPNVTVPGDLTVSGTLTSDEWIHTSNLDITGNINVDYDVLIDGTYQGTGMRLDGTLQNLRGAIPDLSVAGSITATGDIKTDSFFLGDGGLLSNVSGGGGTTPTLQEVTTQGATTTDTIQVGNLISTGSITGDGGLLSNIIGSLQLHPNPQKVSAGVRHTAFVDTRGRLWVTGDNSYGQLGTGDGNSYLNEYVQSAKYLNKSITDVSCSGDFTMILDSDGIVYGCGNNEWGQLGIGTENVSVTTFTANATPLTATSISTGGDFGTFAIPNYFTCLLDSNGIVHATGGNYWGQLGIGSTISSNVFVSNATPLTATHISAGAEHVMIIDTNGTVSGTGNNRFNQLGIGSDTADRTVFTSNATPVTANVISSGGFHSMIIDTNGIVFGVGFAGYGALGIGTTPGPTEIFFTANATPIYADTVSAGYLDTLILDTNGIVYGAGYNFVGELGLGNETTILDFTANTTPLTATFINNNNELQYFIRSHVISNNNILVSGAGGYGSGNESINSSNTFIGTSYDDPFEYIFSSSNISSNIIDISISKTSIAYSTTTVAYSLFMGIVDSGGKLWVAGNNEFGQLGLGETPSNRILTHLVESAQYLNKSITNVSCGGDHMVIMDSDGVVYATGFNNNGELGLGDGIDRNVFTSNATPVTASQISAGRNHTMIIDTNGTVSGTGFNYYGQLGIGSTISSTLFTSNATPVTAASISTGEFHTMIIDTNGTVSGTGYNGAGNLGIDSTISSTLFTSNATPVTASQISACQNHTMIIDSNGTVSGTGNNSRGQLGIGNTINSNIFTSNATPVTASKISSGYAHTMIIDSNGTVSGTGGNSYNELLLTTLTASTNVFTSNATPVTASNISAGSGATSFVQNNQPYVSYNPSLEYVLHQIPGFSSQRLKVLEELFYFDSNVRINGTLTASNIVGASPITISSDLVMASGFTLTAGAIEPPAGSESNLKITGTITTSNIIGSPSLTVTANTNVVAEFTASEKLIKYPRVNMTANSDQSYVASASSDYQSPDYEPWEAFNGVLKNLAYTDSWISTTGTYNTGTGLATTTDSFNGVNGSWLKIQLPTAIKLMNYTIHQRGVGYAYSNPPKKGKLYGSTNGSTWSEIDSFDNLSFTSSDYLKINVNNENYYSYFLIHIEEITVSSGSQSYVAIQELELYGYPENDLGDGTSVLFKTVPNTPKTDFLDVYYDAKEYESGNITDESGNEVTGTIGSNVSYTSTEPKAWNFDGTVNGTVSASLTTPGGDWPHTHAIWFKADSITTTQTTNTIGWFGTLATRQSSVVKISPTFIGFDFVNDSQNATLNVQTGIWYHAVFVYPGGGVNNAKIYVNGFDAGATGGSTNAISLPTSTTLYLANQTNGSNPYFNGSIANYRLYDRALSADEVWELYGYQKAYFSVSPDVVTYKAGRVGIGTSEPRAVLDVVGSLNLTNGITYNNIRSMFMAYSTDTTPNKSISWPVVLEKTGYNIGNHYDTTTGWYTAPITGVYSFNIIIFDHSSSSIQYSLKMKPNGQSVFSSSSDNWKPSRDNSVGNDGFLFYGSVNYPFGGSLEIYCEEGDMVGWGVRYNSSTAYLAHCAFSGRLITPI
jgi:alpha-tubulin suppressor-like RCC1 family protein